MKPLESVFTPSDREHLKKILNSSVSTTPAGMDTAAKVLRFLKLHTMIDEASMGAFRALAGGQRERLLSELLWRVTCYVDGSETAILGVKTFELGSGFVANEFKEGDETCWCLVAKKGSP